MSSNDITIEEDGRPEEKVKKLKDELKKCLAEKNEYLAGWQRAKADFINARKEEEERRTELIKFSEADIIKDILPVLDSFNLALNNENWQKLDKIWQEGVKLIYNKLIDILKKHNVEQIESMAKKFNPEEHESMGEIEVDDKEKEGIVIEETRKGYKINDRVIRPSQVKIGKYKS